MSGPRWQDFVERPMSALDEALSWADALPGSGSGWRSNPAFTQAHEWSDQECLDNAARESEANASAAQMSAGTVRPAGIPPDDRDHIGGGE